MCPTPHSSVDASRRSRTGFTLVELLVVIGIIAALTAVLMPALNRAREAAKQVACLSNLRQVGIMAQMYANQFNDYFPMVRRNYPAPPAAATSFDLWMHQLENARLLRKDTYKTPNTVLVCPASYYRSDPPETTNYSWSTYLGNHVTPSEAVKRSRIKRQTEILVAMDGAKRTSQINPTIYIRINYQADWTHVSAQKILNEDIHRNGLNVVFVDGHANLCYYSEPNFSANPQTVFYTNFWRDARDPPYGW